METGLVHMHNLLRWAILILLILSVFKAYRGWKGGKAFDPADRKLWLGLLITSHTTLLLGLFQWLAGRYGLITKGFQGEGSFMKDKFYRFFWLEHPLMMLIAIVLITLGYGMAKKALPDGVKYKKAFNYFLIALVIILLMTPWPFRDVVGRPLFPGM